MSRISGEQTLRFRIKVGKLSLCHLTISLSEAMKAIKAFSLLFASDFDCWDNYIFSLCLIVFPYFKAQSYLRSKSEIYDEKNKASWHEFFSIGVPFGELDQFILKI